MVSVIKLNCRPSLRHTTSASRCFTSGASVTQAAKWREGLGPLAQKLPMPTAKDAASSYTGRMKGNVQYMGSYNWLTDAQEPTIVVPGIPPVLQERSTPFEFPPESMLSLEETLRDTPRINSISASPFLPLYAALTTLGAKVNWPSLDFILDAPTLRQLWACLTVSERNENMRAPLRLALEAAGKRTIALHLWPTEPNKLAVRNERARTRNSLTVAPLGYDHQRIVRANHLGLEMLFSTPISACDHPTTTFPPPPLPPPGTSPNVSGLKIMNGGTQIPQSALVELDPRALEGQVPSHGSHASLYLAGIANYYPAGFNNDSVTSVNRYDLRSEPFVQERLRYASRMGRLAALLKTVQKASQKQKSGKLEAWLDGKSIFLYERKDGPTLVPADFQRLFK